MEERTKFFENQLKQSTADQSKMETELRDKLQIAEQSSNESQAKLRIAEAKVAQAKQESDALQE